MFFFAIAEDKKVSFVEWPSPLIVSFAHKQQDHQIETTSEQPNFI